MSSLERAFEESQTNQVNYYSSGKTVGIYVYVNGEKQLFTLESELREQIAQEIEEAKETFVTNAIRTGVKNNMQSEYQTGLNIFNGVLQAIRGK